MNRKGQVPSLETPIPSWDAYAVAVVATTPALCIAG